MKKYDVIIIGGGASGLMSALQFENSSKQVLLIEAGYSLGKKILVTGNGRCNLTNLNMSSDYFNCNIDKYLKQFDEKTTIKYFNAIGLETYSDECGRVYPITNSAKSVVDVMIKRLNKLSNIEVINNLFVENIQITNNGYIIGNKNYQFFGYNLIIANGNIENSFINDLDVKLMRRNPSLVALKTEQNTKNLDGVRINNVSITAKCKKLTKSETGELLFKDNGLSGIAIFNLSTLFARNDDFKGKIIVNLLPNKTKEEIVKLINTRCNLFNNVVDLFTGLFVDKIREEIFKRLKIDEKLRCAKLSKETIAKIAHLIQNLEFGINGFYSNNQVVSGGVDLDSLSLTLEHKKYKGLFFVGEVVNVDGECGGYNLQWAWTSGAIVGGYLK